MASNPVKKPSAPPGPAAEGTKAQVTKIPDRRLRLEDILKLMVADGLVSTAEAEKLARSRTQRFETPLELISDQKWHSLAPPRKVITLDALVEWLAGKLGVPYQHIDPLKIDLVAVTATMSNAYAERYRADAEQLNEREKRNRTEGEALDDYGVARISSFLKSYGEMRKGEQFVMDEVRARARERVRWAAGAGLLVAGLLFAPIPWRRFWTQAHRT